MYQNKQAFIEQTLNITKYVIRENIYNSRKLIIAKSTPNRQNLVPI